LGGILGCLWLLVLAALPAAAAPNLPGTDACTADPATVARVHARMLKAPIAFEARDQGKSFVSRGAGYTLALTPGEALIALRPGGPDKHGPLCGKAGCRRGLSEAPRAASLAAPAGDADAPPPATLRLKLAGAKADATLAGEAPLPGTVNIYHGSDPTQWQTGIVTYAKVRTRGVYPGVGLVYYGNGGRLEYDFVVAPGADAGAIAFTVEGAQRVDTDAGGALVLAVAGGELHMKKPLVYQEIEGKRRPVEGPYRLNETVQGVRVAFQVEGYARDHALVIDPVVEWSTYQMGTTADARGAPGISKKRGNGPDSTPTTTFFPTNCRSAS